MNKIVIDKENKLVLKDNVFELEINVSDLVLEIDGKVLINEIGINSNNLNLCIVMKPKSSLIYNRFMIHNSINEKVDIIQDNDSNIVFNYSFIAKDGCNLDIESKLNGDSNKTDIKVKSVTLDKGKVNIKSSAIVKDHINDNQLLESIKVLLLNNEESVIVPNLLVSSNEVEVNHAATLSCISKEELQYLMSKGLSKDSASRLIRDGYLISNLNLQDDVKERIKDILGGE